MASLPARKMKAFVNAEKKRPPHVTEEDSDDETPADEEAAKHGKKKPPGGGKPGAGKPDDKAKGKKAFAKYAKPPGEDGGDHGGRGGGDGGEGGGDDKGGAEDVEEMAEKALERAESGDVDESAEAMLDDFDPESGEPPEGADAERWAQAEDAVRDLAGDDEMSEDHWLAVAMVYNQLGGAGGGAEEKKEDDHGDGE